MLPVARAALQALHDSQRLATSGANFARSRTVTDGTCAFPNNLVGCENAAETGSVKARRVATVIRNPFLTPFRLLRVQYLSDDLALECQGTEAGKICAARNPSSFPSFMGV